MLRLPASDVPPDQIRGRQVVHVRFASLDSASAAGPQLGDLRTVARPLLDTVAVLPYAKLGTIHGDPTAPRHLPLSSVEIRTFGPATSVNRSHGDAVGGRATPHLLNVYAAPVPTLSDDQRLDAIRDVLRSVAPWRAPVDLVNFVGRGNDGDAIVESWTAEQNEQLDVVRHRYDPEWLFPFARHVGRSEAPEGRP